MNSLVDICDGDVPDNLRDSNESHSACRRSDEANGSLENEIVEMERRVHETSASLSNKKGSLAIPLLHHMVWPYLHSLLNTCRVRWTWVHGVAIRRKTLQHIDSIRIVTVLGKADTQI
jgi:hypothetical protein